jgi:hypothetical protein
MRLRKNLPRDLVGVVAAAGYSARDAVDVGLVSFDKLAMGRLDAFL